MRKAYLGLAIVSLLTLVACAAKSPASNVAGDQPSTVRATTTDGTEVQTVTETQEIPFDETTVNDPTLLVGTTVVQTAGKNGVKTLTFQVTMRDGTVVDKKLISEEVTTPPVTQVVAVGTKQPAPPAQPPAQPAQRCHPSYTGACVPIASDVDCAGGTGNGPAYVQGPVYIVGPDVYDLDRDGDGVACE